MSDSITVAGELRKDRVFGRDALFGRDVLWINGLKSQEADEECSGCMDRMENRRLLHILGSFAVLSPAESTCGWMCLLLFSLGSAVTVLHQRNSFFQMMLRCHPHNVHHLTAFCSLQLQLTPQDCLVSHCFLL